MISINCRGRLLHSIEPIVMGVINITPDSFYAGSRFLEFDKVESQVENMITQGATIIDVGAMSTRPGAKIISAEEELSRLLKPIQKIRKSFPNTFISLDTINGQVAKACLDEGIDMINDISGGNLDSSLIDVVAASKVPYVIMHMLGTPEMMQNSPKYDDVVMSVLSYLKKKVHALETRGISELIIDPGFGFGKTLEHNYKLLKYLNVFKIMDYPVLVGMSRKRMIQEVINANAENALNGTTAAHMLALQNGAQILRVHDVKEAKQTIEIYKLYRDTIYGLFLMYKRLNIKATNLIWKTTKT